MFDRPSDEELYDEIDRHRSDWLKEFRNREVAIIGGGLAGIIAGFSLEKDGVSTAIIQESEHLGGRLFWNKGPLPIFSPAYAHLDEFGIESEGNPPEWIDRNHLFGSCLGTYFNRGGLAIRGILIDEKSPRSDGEDGFNLNLTLNENRETLNFEDVIYTVPDLSPEIFSEESDDPLEREVKNTARRSDNFVQAGLCALSKEMRESGLPLENAHILSGVKSSEIVFNEKVTV